MERPLVTLEELTDPRHAALLVIDVQKDYCDPRLAGFDTSTTEVMLPRLQRLMEAARQAGVPVIHVHNDHPDHTNSISWLGRKWTDDGPQPERARPGTEGAEFMPGFEPRPGEIVVAKNRYSGFVGTNLELILRSMGIKTIITTGTATNNCVEATARHGFMLDFYLVFMSDATSTYDERLQEATLMNIRNHYGTVATVDEVVRCWQPAGAEVKSAVGAAAGAAS